MAASLTACVTFGDLTNGLNALVGQPIERAIDVLGYPTQQMQIAGDTVYVWGVDRQGSMLLPQTSTMYGRVGNTPISAQTTTMQAVPMNASCTIKLGVGPDNVIRRMNWEGNHFGCDPYAKRVKMKLGG